MTGGMLQRGLCGLVLLLQVSFCPAGEDWRSFKNYDRYLGTTEAIGNDRAGRG